MKYSFVFICTFLPCYLVAQAKVLPVSQNELRVLSSIKRNDSTDIRKSIEQGLQKNAVQALSGNPSKISQNSEKSLLITQNNKQNSCLPYNNLKITGITLVDKKQFVPADCLNKTSLNLLSRQIIDAYVKAGYPLTNINFSQKDKQLYLNVIEGKIGNITGASRTVNIDMLFPHYKNHPLDIHYLEQGIEQANALQGNQLSMDIYPQKDGSTTIALKNKASKPWFVRFGIDNYGNKPNPMRFSVNAGIDSPLGLSDMLFLGAYTNVTNKAKSYNRGANFYYRLPYGTWSFNLYGSASKGKKWLDFPASSISLAYNSQSQSAGLGAEKVLSRGASHITSAYGSLDYYHQVSKLDGSKIAVQSPTLSSVQFGLRHLQKFSKTTWINDISVEKGITAFGASQKNNPSFTPEYARLNVKSELNHIYHQKNSWLLSSNHSLSVQYSNDDLYAEKSFDATSRYAVRGFDNTSLSANKGAVLRNIFSARYYTKNAIYVEPYIGLDAGIISENNQTNKAFGTTLGINVGNSKNWAANVQASRGYAKSHAGSGTQEEQISASFQWNF